MFQPYNWQQLCDIVQQRLGPRHKAAIESPVVQLVAKRVAMVNGDVRNMLDILRRAVDIAINASASRVEMKHVCVN